MANGDRCNAHERVERRLDACHQGLIEVKAEQEHMKKSLEDLVASHKASTQQMQTIAAGMAKPTDPSVTRSWLALYAAIVTGTFSVLVALIVHANKILPMLGIGQ